MHRRHLPAWFVLLETEIPWRHNLWFTHLNFTCKTYPRLGARPSGWDTCIPNYCLGLILLAPEPSVLVRQTVGGSGYSPSDWVPAIHRETWAAFPAQSLIPCGGGDLGGREVITGVLGSGLVDESSLFIFKSLIIHSSN